MGWSGSLTAGSAVGSAITFTPDTSGIGAYTVASFTAPQKGVYRFDCKGSGGHHGITGSVQTPAPNIGTGGAGGSTAYHILLDAGQTVYVGCGGACAAAFVSNVRGDSLAEIQRAHIHCIAGGGGGGGAVWGSAPYPASDGGNGGGASGAAGENVINTNSGNVTAHGGSGGTQTSGYAYGAGAPNQYVNVYFSTRSGRGGDGLYGGATGEATGSGDGAGGGGGGSGYVYRTAITVGGKDYANTTSQGGGAAANARGSVRVTYVAAGELPVVYNGTRLTSLVFNNVRVGSLIYNGTRLFCRRAAACFTRMARRSLSRRATPACSP